MVFQKKYNTMAQFPKIWLNLSVLQLNFNVLKNYIFSQVINYANIDFFLSSRKRNTV